ncbi:hypothetical protein MKW92_018307 [Papaver armeniacum]|nr:hypothetical protein MKW92_018307 [Papaver armeniacum]
MGNSKTYTKEKCLCAKSWLRRFQTSKKRTSFFYFTSIQQVRISYAIEAKRHRSIVNHDPTIADEYKVLLDKLPELADILKLPEAKALKDRFQTTSSDIQEPSQDSKDLEETLDSQDSDQFIEAIFGELDGIASEIKHHDELLECCFRLFQKVVDFINVLESWIKQNGEATKKEREENIVRQKEDVTKKKSGGRAIRGPRGGGGSDSSNRLHVGNLSQNVDDQALEGLFSSQGKVLEARVVYDRDTGMSRGFGFVTYRSTKDRNYALTSLNGADLGGRKIRVSVAETRSRGF